MPSSHLNSGTSSTRFGGKRPTALHPTTLTSQANGTIEIFHWTMKASLMARLRNNPNWMEELPVVMLGLPTADLGCSGSSAELVYGTHLRLPGEFFEAPGAFEHTCPVDLNSSSNSPRDCPYQLAHCTQELHPRFHPPGQAQTTPYTPVRWSLPGGQQVRQVLHCRHGYQVGQHFSRPSQAGSSG